MNNKKDDPPPPDGAQPPRKRGRPRKDEQRPKPEPTRLERQTSENVNQMLAELPTACDVGCKKNSKGYKETWVGSHGQFQVKGEFLALRPSSVDISPLALGIIGLQISRGFGGRAPMRVTALVALLAANSRTHSCAARREYSHPIGQDPALYFGFRVPSPFA